MLAPATKALHPAPEGRSVAANLGQFGRERRVLGSCRGAVAAHFAAKCQRSVAIARRAAPGATRWWTRPRSAA